MTRNQRLGLLLISLALLIVAFIVLRPDGEDEPSAVNTTTLPAPPPGTTQPVPPPPPKPGPGPLLTRGVVRTIVVRKGATVRFRARSAVAEELHVHGYDITRQLPAGKTIRVRFKATIDGIFEIELHRSGTQIGSLRVEL